MSLTARLDCVHLRSPVSGWSQQPSERSRLRTIDSALPVAEIAATALLDGGRRNFALLRDCPVDATDIAWSPRNGDRRRVVKTLDLAFASGKFTIARDAKNWMISGPEKCCDFFIVPVAE